MPDSRLPLSQALFTVKAVPVGVVHCARCRESHAGSLAGQSERVESTGCAPSSPRVVDVLELAVEHAVPRTGV